MADSSAAVGVATAHAGGMGVGMAPGSHPNSGGHPITGDRAAPVAAPLNFAWARALESYVESSSHRDAREAAPSSSNASGSRSGGPQRATSGAFGQSRAAAGAPGHASSQGQAKNDAGGRAAGNSEWDTNGAQGTEGSAEAEEAALEQQVLAHLRRLMENSAGAQQRQGPGQPRTSNIPIFFKKKPDQESLSARAQLCAKYKFLQKQRQGLLDQGELEVIWMCLREHRTQPDDESGAERINYDDFTQAAAACAARVGPKSRRFFTAATFLTFEADDSGRIAILPFYLYIMRWVSITQTRIDMCLLDKDNDGFLTPEEMEAYIRGLVPSLRLLRDMDLEFLPLYCKIATRKFLFFCDPQRRGKLLIREVLLSPVLSELMELRQEPEGEEQQAALQENWFALVPSRRIYEMFVALDVDQSGGLSKVELRAFNDDNLTDIFIERVFDCHVRRARRRGSGSGDLGPGQGKSGEMDLESFLDLVLALDNKHTPEGLAYIFKCLDLNERGYLTTTDVYTLFRSVHRRWMEGGNYELMIEDVKDEIWDMVKPQDALRITLEDLVECKQGDTVASMLIDIAGFWAHDNRENLAAQQDPAEM